MFDFPEWALEMLEAVLRMVELLEQILEKLP